MPNSLSLSLSLSPPQKVRGRQNGCSLLSSSSKVLGRRRCAEVLRFDLLRVKGMATDSEYRRADMARLSEVKGALKRFCLLSLLWFQTVSLEDEKLAGVGGMSLNSGGCGGSRGF